MKRRHIFSIANYGALGAMLMVWAIAPEYQWHAIGGQLLFTSGLVLGKWSALRDRGQGS